MDNTKTKVSRIMVFAINACLLYLVGKSFIGSLIYTYSELELPWCSCIAEGIVILLTVVMSVIQRNDLPSYGIRRSSNQGNFKYIIPLVLLSLMLMPYFFLLPLTDPVVPAFLDIIYIGIMEEFIFRGLIFRAAEVITDENKAIIISSVMFGLIHLVNLSGDFTWQFVLLQVAFNAVIGLGLGALRARTKSIFVGIMIHFFLDINGLFDGSISWMENAQIVMYFVVGILLYIFYLKEIAKKEDNP